LAEKYDEISLIMAAWNSNNTKIVILSDVRIGG
jgi:hypothetical protein